MAVTGTITGPTNFPNEQAFLLGLAQYNQQLEQAQYAWGQQQYANTSALTDQVVNRYLDNASVAAAAASGDLQRYQQLFQPQENALIRDANTYASNDRIQSEMGRAQAGVGQQFDQARQSAERDLQSYGINPGDGRYAALENASRAQEAAAKAGAGNQARQQTEATGRALRSEAIQVGQRYPANVVNYLNTGLQALAGGENAKLANTALGSQMLGRPQDYGSLAAGLRYPPQASPTSGGGQVKSGGNGGGRVGGGPGGIPAGPSYSSGSNGSSWNPMGGSSGTPYGGSSSGYGGYGGLGIKSGLDGKGYPGEGSQGPSEWQNFYDPSGYDYYNTGYGADMGAEMPYEQQYSADAGNNYVNAGDYDWSSQFGSGDTSGWDQWSSTPDWSGVSGADSYSSGSFSDAGYDGGGDYGYSDYGQYGYAQGGDVEGGIPSPGVVQPQMSPTGGAATDDVSARLNVGEFVIPEDVARWKGQEFFQKLIEQSRKARTGAPAKGKMKPALNQRPTFQSEGAGGIPA